MALNPPPTIDLDLCLVRVLLNNSALTRDAECTFAVFDTGGTGPAAVANAVQTAWNANIANHMDSNVTNGPFLVTEGQGTTSALVGVNTGANIAGGTVQNSPPPNVAVLLKKSTGFAGRKNRGRLFLPWWVDVTHIDEAGHITPATVAALQTSVTAFLAALSAANIPMHVANKTLSSPTPPNHVTAVTAGHIVTALTVESVVATQRRRVVR